MTILDKYNSSILKKSLPRKKDPNYKKYSSILKVVEGLAELQGEFESRKKGNALSGHFVSLGDVFREYQQAIVNLLDVPSAYQRSRNNKVITPVKFKNVNPNRNTLLVDDGCDGCTQKDRNNQQLRKSSINTSGATVKEEFRKHPNQEDLKRGRVREVITQLPNPNAIPANTPLDEVIDFENNAPRTWKDVYDAFSGDANNLYNLCMIMTVKGVKPDMKAIELAKQLFLVFESDGLTREA